MREKTLKFMSLTLTPFEKTVHALVEDFRQNFKKNFGDGELPVDVSAAVSTVEQALNEKKDQLRDDVAALYEAEFTEYELDALIAHQESPLGRKLAQVTPSIVAKLTERSNLWLADAMASVEPELAKHLGVNTAQPSKQPTDAPAPSAA